MHGTQWHHRTSRPLLAFDARQYTRQKLGHGRLQLTTPNRPAHLFGMADAGHARGFLHHHDVRISMDDEQILLGSRRGERVFQKLDHLPWLQPLTGIVCEIPIDHDAPGFEQLPNLRPTLVRLQARITAPSVRWAISAVTCKIAFFESTMEPLENRRGPSKKIEFQVRLAADSGPTTSFREFYGQSCDGRS